MSRARFFPMTTRELRLAGTFQSVNEFKRGDRI